MCQSVVTGPKCVIVTGNLLLGSRVCVSARPSRLTIHPADFTSVSLRAQGRAALKLLQRYLKNEKHSHV